MALRAVSTGCIEGVGDVLGDPAGCYEHDIEADVVLRIIGMMSEPKLGCGNDPALGAFRHGFRRVVGALARIDLDKNENPAAPRDDIDLAKGCFPAPRRDPVAFGDEKHCGAAFGG